MLRQRLLACLAINGFRAAPSRLLLMPRHGPSVAFAGIARVGRDFWQALKAVLVAKTEWLAAAKKHKKPVPVPRYRPAIYALAR